MGTKIELGYIVRDKITGFQGVAISKVQYIDGLIQFGVQPKVKSDGEMLAAEYIDANRIEVISE